MCSYCFQDPEDGVEVHACICNMIEYEACTPIDFQRAVVHWCAQQQGDAVSSDDDEAQVQDCAPSGAAALDPNLLHDVQAGSQSPVAFSAKAAQEEADLRLAMQLQGQDNDGMMSNELSGLQVSPLC